MRRLKRWWPLLLLLPIVLMSILGVWVSRPALPMPEALAALESDSAVRVDTSRWLTFTPVDTEPTTGLVFYPGGLVDARAYAPLARAAAEAGNLAVIVPMPLNLAVLNLGAATEVIAAYPNIEHWAISGHSLGGSMAARFVADNPGKVDGLILMASYPDRDLSSYAIDTASLYGENDGLATVAQVEGSAPQLPPDTEFVEIVGGNHAFFGWYGDQARDNPATITREEQQAQVIATTLEVLDEINGE
jgi:pimeloyl-ACP methyl ester carboxylesterase